MTDHSSRLTLACDLAREAGALAREMRATQGAGFIAEKGPQDFVTAADQAVEALLRQRLLAAFPEDGFLGEEGGRQMNGAYTWVVDPIDGTTNYLRGLPEWGISIGCIHGDELLLGVIYLPDLDRMATGLRGQGAFLDGQRLNLAAQVATGSHLGILGHSDRVSLDSHLDSIEGLLGRGFDYRRQGSACFGLLAVAAGWADFYFEAHLNPWDAMAGLLLISEAGGNVSYGEMPTFLDQGHPVLAAHPRLAPEITALLLGIADIR